MRLGGRVNQPQGDRQELDDAILSLPLRLGGLGVLSHLSVAPHALAASNEAADRHIDAFMNIQFSQQDIPPAAVKSEHERCQAMWERTQTSLIGTLDDTERKLLTEAASPLGWKWLNTIPFYQPLYLTDFEVSTALNYRTLACSPLTTCSWCSRPNSLGHDELCMTRPRQTVARHESLARIIHSTLKTIDPTAEHEPHSFEGRRRNDIRLRGPFRGTIDYDIKVYTLLAANATNTTTRAPENVSLPAHITQQSLKYLDGVGRHATHVRPLTNGRFIPLVFSAGGLMAKDTASELEIWRKEMGATKFTRMITLLSMALLKAKGRSFDIARSGRQEGAPEGLNGEFDAFADLGGEFDIMEERGSDFGPS